MTLPLQSPDGCLPRRILALAVLVLLWATGSYAQSTTVSGTITDSGGQAWFDGTYSFNFNPNGTTGPYYWNGSPYTPTVISGDLDASGSFTVSVPSNTSITPRNSLWNVTVCPAATAPCFTQAINVTGTSQSISSLVIPGAIKINAANPPGNRIAAYSNAEIYSADWGFQYYDLTADDFQVCGPPATGNPPSPRCTWSIKTGGVGTGTAQQMAIYPATGQHVAGDSALLDNGATLSYSGSGGIQVGTPSTYDLNINAPSGMTANQSVTLPNATGTLPLQPHASDAIQHVSMNGSDTNDGESWGSAKSSINAAVSTLTSGGTIYVAPGASITFTSTISLGTSPASNPIRLVLGSNTVLNCAVTSGDCIDLYGKSTITGGLNSIIQTTSAANVANVLNVGGGQFVQQLSVSNVQVWGASGTVSHAVVFISGGGQSSYMRHVDMFGAQSGTVPTLLVSINDNGNWNLEGVGANFGGPPCEFSGTANATLITMLTATSLTCEDANANEPNVLFTSDASSQYCDGVHIYGLYLEPGANMTASEPAIEDHGCQDVSLDGVYGFSLTNQYLLQIDNYATPDKVSLSHYTWGSQYIANDLVHSTTFQDTSAGADAPQYTFMASASGTLDWIVPGGVKINGIQAAVRLRGQLTTTAATSDNLTITGVTTSSICQLSAANASAATNIATTYVSAVSANTVTVTHTATSGMIYNVSCSVN